MRHASLYPQWAGTTQFMEVQTGRAEAGTVVLLSGAACSVVAYRVMLRVGRLPEEARVLR